MKHEVYPSLVILQPEGRLDAHGAKAFDEGAEAALQEDTLFVAVDMSGVSYLSSAGLRSFLALFKKLSARKGGLVAYHLTDYVKEVFNIAGFSGSIHLFETEEDALNYLKPLLPAEAAKELGEKSEVATIQGGTIKFIYSDETAHGTVDVMGDINDVLHSRVTEKHLANKPFFETEYSLGLGALGANVEDYIGIMGESIMIGGTMVWLPTDGNDTADFLIPKQNSSLVTLRTGFNVCVRGGFAETVLFESDKPEGLTISEIYRELFDLAKKRRPDYKGSLGLAMHAEVVNGYGCGITKSPILEFKPENGEMITHPDNFASWFEIDKEPRLKNLTALICGIGMDMEYGEFPFNKTYLNRTFYFNPSNTGSNTVQLHNHAVFFSPQPFNEHPRELKEEIEAVVENGDFIDMRHLLDQTTIKRAVIGISYVQEFCEDTRK